MRKKNFYAPVDQRNKIQPIKLAVVKIYKYITYINQLGKNIVFNIKWKFKKYDSRISCNFHNESS